MAESTDRIIQAIQGELVEVLKEKMEELLNQGTRLLNDGTYPLMTGNCHEQEHMPKLPGTEQQRQVQGPRGRARARTCPSRDSTSQSHARKAETNDRSSPQYKLRDTIAVSDAPRKAEHLERTTSKPHAVEKRKVRNLRYKPGARASQVHDARKPKVRRAVSDVYHQPTAGVTSSDGNYQPGATKTDVNALKVQGCVKIDWYERHPYIETSDTDEGDKEGDNSGQENRIKSIWLKMIVYWLNIMWFLDLGLCIMVDIAASACSFSEDYTFTELAEECRYYNQPE
jgi:hypothetical protein